MYLASTTQTLTEFSDAFKSGTSWDLESADTGVLKDFFCRVDGKSNILLLIARLLTA